MGIAKEGGVALLVAWASVLRGWALFQQGGGATAIAEMRKGIEDSRATGASLLDPYWLALLASVHGQLGEAEDGLAATAEALAEVAETGERFWQAELHRLKGQLLLESDAANKPEAEVCFCRAIEIARSQKAKSWELRAATSLSRLWQQQRKATEARDLLAPVYAWFTEGSDTPDLKDAKALLDELS